MKLERFAFFGLLMITILALYASGFFEGFMRGYETVEGPQKNLSDLTLYTMIFLTWYFIISILYYSFYRVHRLWRLRKLAKEHGTGASAMRLEPSETEVEEELEELDSP